MPQDETQRLEEENELLRRQLKELTGTNRELGVLVALGHGMTQTLAVMLYIMVKRSPACISRATFHSLMYGDRSDGGPEPKIFDVRIHRLRAILQELGCSGKIKTVWHAGYQASPELVKWVRGLYDNRIPKE